MAALTGPAGATWFLQSTHSLARCSIKLLKSHPTGCGIRIHVYKSPDAVFALVLQQFKSHCAPEAATNAVPGQMTVAELKAALTALNLSPIGKKAALVQRLELAQASSSQQAIDSVTAEQERKAEQLPAVAATEKAASSKAAAKAPGTPTPTPTAPAGGATGQCCAAVLARVLGARQ